MWHLSNPDRVVTLDRMKDLIGCSGDDKLDSFTCQKLFVNTNMCRISNDTSPRQILPK